MNPRKETAYVPIIGTSFFPPLVTLLEKLTETNKSVNEVQTSSLENGYAVSTITIAVFIVESAICRYQYLRGDIPPLKPREFAEKYFREYQDDLEELFVLRDVIAHNHLWNARIWNDEKGDLHLASATMLDGFGDKKFRRVVDQKTRLTRRLGLNAFPTRIWYNDAVLVLRKMIDFLESLDGDEGRVFNLANHWVRYGGKHLMLIELIRSLKLAPDGEGQAA